MWIKTYKSFKKVDEQIGSDATALQKPENRWKEILLKLSAYFMEDVFSVQKKESEESRNNSCNCWNQQVEPEDYDGQENYLYNVLYRYYLIQTELEQ